MARRLIIAVLLVAMFLGQSTSTVMPFDQTTVSEVNARSSDIRISEILVSASSEQYNGTDWNNYGAIGSSSDHFIELWNAGTDPVDVSDCLLDYVA